MKYLLCLFLIVAAYAYERPETVGEAQWDYTAPYFLPEDHPAKGALDQLFSTRVIASPGSLRDAGFKTVAFNMKTGVHVLRHKKLKGYVIKLYTDDWGGVCDWCMWVKRAKGANYIREAIDRHGFTSFTVPKKWVYPLPHETYPNNAVQAKDFIMLVEDLEPVDEMHNKILWKSSLVTHARLNEFYILLNEVGLLDSVYSDNVPFVTGGKIGFIDTEHFHEWPVPMPKITLFLNKKMGAYWMQLVNQGGPR